MIKLPLYTTIFVLAFAVCQSNAQTIINYNPSSGYYLTVDGDDYVVKGAACEGNYLEILKEYGGNTIRTWTIDKKTLDKAHELGLKVVAGIWLDHLRHNDDFDYNDPKYIKKQRKKVESIVKKYKDHPALLAWGLGNEVELHVPEEMLTPIWKELNILAKMVKSLDENHPVVTSIAGCSEEKIESVKRYYPACDILGVNGYGFAPKVGEYLLKYGWEKPYMITEFGPLGTWETGRKSDWGALVEETSHQKAERYLKAYLSAMNESPNYCLGVFPFFWDSKQETTATWFGMFLKEGARLEAVDAIAYGWNGEYPENRVPEIHSIESSAKLKEVASRSIHMANIQVIDHENDPLKYRWVIMDESKVKSVGGDFEPTPKSYPRLIIETDGPRVKFKAPRKKGPYRLFAYAEDNNQGAATVNFPFYVK